MAKQIHQPRFSSGRVTDKLAVAASFSRAAGSYDQVAKVQRWVITRLMADLASQKGAGCVLDIGCGTGYLMERVSECIQPEKIMGLDIAEGMTNVATKRTGHPAICGDAEAMPFPGGMFDLLVSSFALQWCPDLESVFAESFRTLRRGGRFYFTLPVAGTLSELKNSWQLADPGNSHVNDFYNRDDIQFAARRAGFQSVSVSVIEHREFFPGLREITDSLKAMGAHNVTEGRAKQLTGKQKLSMLREAYEAYRTAEGLPLTWQVAFGELRK